MLSEIVKKLEPFEFELKETLPKFVKQAFKDKGIKQVKDMEIPLKPVALLGKCATKLFLECPNIPDWHLRNAAKLKEEVAEKGEKFDYFDYLGVFYWFDFDAIAADETILPLRMAFNEGDADTNDGVWGAVWNRETEGLIANLKSTGDTETTIEVISKSAEKLFKSQKMWIPIPSEPMYESESESDFSPYGVTFVFEHNSPLEKIISLAIRYVGIYLNEENYNLYGYNS